LKKNDRVGNKLVDFKSYKEFIFINGINPFEGEKDGRYSRIFYM